MLEQKVSQLLRASPELEKRKQQEAQRNELRQQQAQQKEKRNHLFSQDPSEGGVTNRRGENCSAIDCRT